MPLVQTRGAASAQGFGEFAQVTAVNYIEDVFSTYLYTGNGSVQSISNGINLGSTYGGSGYFGGATAASGLTAPASTSWQLTGGYTVEAWIYVVTLADGTIYATGGSGAADQFTYTAAGELYFANQGTGTGVITAGSWIHVAAARSGTTQKIFVNGVVQSTTTVSGTIGQNATAYIGRRVDTDNYVTGYISNLRVVNGTAVYTSNFTPSTVPLTAITNTVLLTCQANGFVDASTNAFTITNSGAIATTNYGPFTSATAGKGGLTWFKVRNHTWGHILTDTVRGATTEVFSDLTAGNITNTDNLTAFTSSGFSVGNGNAVNQNNKTFVSWTWRKQPKYFDIVTWTGTGSNTTIAHSLGSVPGCIMVKRTDTSSAWAVYHRSLANTQYLVLNTTAAAATGATRWNSTTPTSTVFSIGTDASVNASGGTYVAYLFAHNAGGFGLTGTDNVISCGSFTADGSGVANVTLGYEPQWILFKPASTGNDWQLLDTMRGWSNPPAPGTGSAFLFPNTSYAETSLSVADGGLSINATGFGMNANDGNHRDQTFVYIAIRRGPMKVPTSGASVFGVISALEPVSTNQTTQSGVLTDTVVNGLRVNQGGFGPHWLSRLTGNGAYLISSSTATEVTQGNFWKFDNNNFAYIPPSGYANNDGTAKYVAYSFNRAPSFFDVVCYTNNASGPSVQVNTHNLGVLPELAITKVRNDVTDWFVGSNIGATTFTGSSLNTTGAGDIGRSYTSSSAYKGFTTTTFSVGSSPAVGAAGFNVVTYLFATCPGVSKVGSYTGTGTTLQINCGFTAGARFVLIKRTDSTGDWYVWDSARGIVSGNDPYLLLNSTAAEVTGTDYVDTYSAGFEISSTAPAAINASAGSFIFLAIA